MPRSLANGTGRAPLRVLVLGTGAMGCLFAARLARLPDADITIVGTWKAALDAIAANGIHVVDPQGEWTAKVATAHRDAALPMADMALVLVKQRDTLSAAQAAAKAIRPEGLVLSLQNGLGADSMLLLTAGAARTSIGVTSAGASLERPGVVRSGGGGPTYIGGTASHKRLKKAAALLTRAGFPAEVDDDIEPRVWLKLAVNCAINPVTALLGKPNGVLLEDRVALAVALTAADEVRRVFEADGGTLPDDPASAVLRVAGATSENRSSMLQDLQAGRPTEIRAINGAVVQRGATHRIPTPANLWLTTQILRLETAQPASSLAGCPVDDRAVALAASARAPEIQAS